MSELTCEVLVDGQRLADTAAELSGSVPTVLADLAVRWGRASVVDQPETSTCSFVVADVDGDADFLGLLHVGRKVTVYAAGALADAGTTDVAVDGGFEDNPMTSRVLTTAPAALSFTQSDERARTLAVRPGAAAWPLIILDVPPAPFTPDPAGWDTIPTVSNGETWTVRLAVRPGRGQDVTVRPNLWRNPHGATRPVHLGGATAVTAADAGPDGWVDVDIAVDVGASTGYGWLGVTVEVRDSMPWTDWAGPWLVPVVDGAPTWADLGTGYLDDLRILAPNRAVRRVLVFTGRITDLAATYRHPGIRVAVTAVDVTAELGNAYVGDIAWNVEPLGTRAARVLTLSGLPVVADIDPRIAALRVTWRDVDNQPAYALLTELAETGDGVLWSAEHATRGAYLWLEDTAERAALGILTWDVERRIVYVSGNVRPSHGIVLSSCVLDRDPVTWAQNVTDVVTRVDATWLEQTVNDEGRPEPTERHELIIDAPAETQFGTRRIGYSTQLVDAAGARDVAVRVLGRSRTAGWHATGLRWDTRIPARMVDADRRAALDLLDGTRRIGLPLTVTDLPPWSPGGDVANLYVEGGDYVYTGGRWTFDTLVSPAGASGYSATWEDLDPAWAWNELDPAIDWWAMWGLSAEYASPRWTELDDHPWTDDGKTWDSYYGPQTAAGQAA